MGAPRQQPTTAGLVATLLRCCPRAFEPLKLCATCTALTQTTPNAAPPHLTITHTPPLAPSQRA